MRVRQNSGRGFQVTVRGVPLAAGLVPDAKYRYSPSWFCARGSAEESVRVRASDLPEGGEAHPRGGCAFGTTGDYARSEEVRGDERGGPQVAGGARGAVRLRGPVEGQEYHGFGGGPGRGVLSSAERLSIMTGHLPSLKPQRRPCRAGRGSRCRG